jgi:hypothetical protein
MDKKTIRLIVEDWRAEHGTPYLTEDWDVLVNALNTAIEMEIKHATKQAPDSIPIRISNPR